MYEHLSVVKVPTRARARLVLELKTVPTEKQGTEGYVRKG